MPQGAALEDLLASVVAIPSPTGHEDAVVAFLQARAAADGYTVGHDAAGNLLLEAGPPGPTLMLLGHVDTVPGGPTPRLEGRTLWGRGAVDAKGPLVAAYAAGLALAAAGVHVRVVGAVGEEGDSRGARALLSDPRVPDAVIVLEPSGWDAVTVGYKGIIRGGLSVTRPPTHGGHPGGSPADALVDAWTAVRARLAFADGFAVTSGRLDALAGRHGQDNATARFQVRLPPDVRPEDAAAALREAAEEHGASVTVDEAVPAVLCDQRSDLVSALRAAIRGAGGRPRLLHKTGTADLNLVAPAWPVPMCAYGPGDSMLDHTPDERLHLDDLHRAVAVLVAAGQAWHAARTAPRPPGPGRAKRHA